MSDKQEIAARLRRGLEEVAAERARMRQSPDIAAARLALKRFQSARMASTHADLLAARDTRAAARFFLDDLYGTHDMTRRDADLARIVPTMQKTLPASALGTVAEAIALDALSEGLDAAMAARLGSTFDERAYAAAYRATGTPADRERQIALVREIGLSLCALVRIPLIGGTLAMMRRPARAAGLEELHGFLERGFSAFKAMRDPAGFVSCVVDREEAIMRRLYAGDPMPFAPVGATG